MGNAPDDTNVANALTLDGEADAIKGFYGRSAETYDADLGADYGAAHFIAGIVDAVVREQGATLGIQRDTARILDAGCGTGLVGAALHDLGYRSVDGVDLSQEMVDKANQRGIYNMLEGNVDLSRALPTEWQHRWDICVSCGVFTLGHVPPESLNTLINATRPGGIIAVSTRTAYYDQGEYETVVQQLIDSGRIALIHEARDGPYTEDSRAHYWVYEVK